MSIDLEFNIIMSYFNYDIQMQISGKLLACIHYLVVRRYGELGSMAITQYSAY